MAINSGLSVTVCGYLLSVERDEENRVGKIVCSKLPDGHLLAIHRELTGTDKSAITVAAELLAARAKRFLGNWRIVPMTAEQLRNMETVSTQLRTS